MPFDDRPIQWLAPLAAAGIILAIAVPVFRKLGFTGWPLARSLIITVILGLAALWLALNAVNLIDHLRDKRSRRRMTIPSMALDLVLRCEDLLYSVFETTRLGNK